MPNSSPRALQSIALSIVVPVYGCAESLNELHARLVRTLEPAVDSFEIIFVDDRSDDGAWTILEALAQCDPHVVAVRLSRNFGQQLAISAGLAESRGERVVVMDCDLQDPPEVIPEMLARLGNADILMMRRRSAYHGRARLWAGRLYFRLLSALCGLELQPDFGSFSLITRKVARAFCSFREVDRHYNFILLWLGFERKTMDYSRDCRRCGESTYTLQSLLHLAVSGIFFQTTVFLSWVIQGGLFISLIGIAAGLVYAAIYFMGTAPPPGWTSLIVVNLFLGGAIIICIGTVGLYVGKIFEHSKGRPLYVVDVLKRHGDASAEDSS